MSSINRSMAPIPRWWGRHPLRAPAPDRRMPGKGRHRRGGLWRNVPALLCLLLCFTSGCTSARRVTIPDWQQGVVKYVKDEGEGRLSVLRDVTLRGGRRGFAVLGHPLPERAHDVVGLLLAHRPVQGRPTFIYLLAQVARTQIRDLRLATLSEREGQFDWNIGPEDDPPRRAYLQWREARWRSVYPDRKDPPLSYQGFPLEEDVFNVAIDDHAIVAEHPPSGARWTLAIPATQPAGMISSADRTLP